MSIEHTKFDDVSCPCHLLRSVCPGGFALASRSDTGFGSVFLLPHVDVPIQVVETGS